MSGAEDPKRDAPAAPRAGDGAEAQPAAEARPPEDRAPEDLPGEGDLLDESELPDDVRDALAAADAGRGARRPGESGVPEAEVGGGSLDEVDVRELLRGALRPPAAAPPNLLRGVQRRLRTRSRGKFYGDGWSTTRSPRSIYLTTSILMLVLIAFVFLVLIPWGGGALP